MYYLIKIRQLINNIIHSIFYTYTNECNIVSYLFNVIFRLKKIYTVDTFERESAITHSEHQSKDCITAINFTLAEIVIYTHGWYTKVYIPKLLICNSYSNWNLPGTSCNNKYQPCIKVFYTNLNKQIMLFNIFSSIYFLFNKHYFF